MIKLTLILCCLPALSMLAYSTFALIKDLQARRWPTAEGLLTHIKGLSVGRGLAKTDIAYDYEVRGQKYTGNRYSFGYLAGGVIGGSEVSAKIKRELPQKPSVRVYYNPSNPRESVLVPGTTWIHLINFLVGGAFLVPVVLISASRL
jgi:hypothetical protein